MRIGIIGTLWFNIPPTGYGGTEEVLYNLCNSLVDRGHQVTLFGPATSRVRATVFPTVSQPLRSTNTDWTNTSYTLAHITAAFNHASEFDILHMHLNKSQDYMALPFGLYSKTPVLYTIHFKLPTKRMGRDRYRVLVEYSKMPYTSISDSQRGDIPLRFIRTVYNGINIKHYPFCEKANDYVVWLGRINAAKGTRSTILAAKKAGVKLILLGVVSKGEPGAMEYYESQVKPLIDGKQIVFKGEANLDDKVKYVGRAKALLNPIQWQEPFGLVMVEAQCLGTPVISFARGAAPELIVDGKTGFLVNTIDQMAKKIGEIDRIDRSVCRKNVVDHFSIESMAKSYEEAYTTTIDHWQTYQDEEKALLRRRY